MEVDMTEDALSKGERTRQAILDAAYGLFVDQGYAASSMRQIAQQAGVALGSIYNHFASKDEVFRAIISERHPFYQIVPVLNSAQGETVEEFVHNAAHALIDQLGRQPDFLNLMLTEIVEFKAEHVPLVFEKLIPMLLPLAGRISDLEGNTERIPQLVLVRAFLGMFFSYYITDILLGPVIPPEMGAEALDHFVDIFLHGILNEETV
jgi:AcrR family transcriptional regulator